MRKIKKLEENSAYIGKLPTGCTYCGPGKKLVLLITGRCKRRCFYCPLSFAKRGKEVIYADELKVNTLGDIILEANNISAKGTGITGGDPMVVPKLTLEAIRLLKATFGDKHHIHLYTTGDFDPKYIDKLAAAGLDELRFHPPLAQWDKVNRKFENLLKIAVKSDLSVGAELPVLPGYETNITQFAKYIDSCGAEFLNLNELEFSESNWESCKTHGYFQKNPMSNSVKGSEESAFQLLQEFAALNDFELDVHYCSALFKDRQQLRNRLLRRAKNVIQPHYVLTDDTTFLLGIVEPGNTGDIKVLEKLRAAFKLKFKVPSKLMKLDYEMHRLEVAPWVLHALKDELIKDDLPKDDLFKSVAGQYYIIEEYPTADRLEVERIPLDEFKDL